MYRTFSCVFLQFVIAVDDENGEEGNLIMGGSFASAQKVAFMIKHGSGIVSVGMKEEDLERLRIPMMSLESDTENLSAAAFTMTVVKRTILPIKIL